MNFSKISKDYNRPRKLTSSEDISHTSHDCHTSLLCCGYSPDKVILVFNFYVIIGYFTQFSLFGSYHSIPTSRPYSSSSAYLSLFQLLSFIIPHHQIRVHFLSDSKYFYYYVIPHQDTLHQINHCQPPSQVPIFGQTPHVTPISRLHQSFSPQHHSVSPDPIIKFHKTINQFTRPYYPV